MRSGVIAGQRVAHATFRRYRLSDRGEIARVQYGINFRQPDGRTYSAPDIPGDGPTRNLGIVMEGATDSEATAIARKTAQSCGITVTGSEPKRRPHPGQGGGGDRVPCGLVLAADRGEHGLHVGSPRPAWASRS